MALLRRGIGIARRYYTPTPTAMILLFFSSLVILLLRFSWSSAAPLDPGEGHYANATGPLVDLGYARYRGASGAGVNQWLGIRFAKAPLGELRFRAPREPDRIPGVVEAVKYGATCLGTGHTLPNTEQEDCLFVNVFAPASATVNSTLPVMLYIQGGGYNTNSNANYNGTGLIKAAGGDMVVVNFNYRVGAYGFLASEEVRQNGDLNVGLLDQRKVMAWVQRYIRLFGGDPDHVVIFGTSAGAGSVAHHLTAYGGENHNLFHGAFAESVFLPRLPTLPDLEFQYTRFANAAGCANTISNSTLSCLRSLSTAQLQAADVASPYPGRIGNARWYFTPVIDGDLIQDRLYAAFEAGKFIKDIPVIFGNDQDEGTYFVANAANESTVWEFLLDQYPTLTTAQLKKITSTMYPLGSYPPLAAHEPYFPLLAAAYGELVFNCPGNFIASTIGAASSEPVWHYRVNIQDYDLLWQGVGVAHTMEIPAIFGRGMTGTDKGFAVGRENEEMVEVVQGYVQSFVRFLDPNTERANGTAEWETWEEGRLKLETGNTEMETVDEGQKARCRKWEEWSAGLEI